MSYKIVDYTNKIIGDTEQKSSIFLRNIAEEIVKVAKPNTPKDTGRLRSDVIKQVLGLKGKIIWSKNYAIYQETKQYRNYTTGGTGPHFAKNAVKEVVTKINSIARKSGLI